MMLNNKTLVVIEDEQAFADILVVRLSRQGYQCQHAADIATGLDLTASLRPNFIVVDMKIGNQNSLAYLSQLRALVPDARIILLTGYASIATAVEAIKNGADDYLAKPVDTQSLLAVLEGKKPQQQQESIMSSARLEWEHIQQALKVNDGNISLTAKQLGMHRRTLQRKLLKKPKAETEQP